MSRLSLEKILSAALKIADQRGLDSLTMRNLADALGVKAMSLYNHIENREALIDALVERVLGEITLPTQMRDWIDGLKQRCLNAFGVLQAHPWASLAIMSRITVGPATLGYIEGTLAIAVSGGCTLPEADHIRRALDSYVYGYVAQEQKFPVEPQQYKEAAAAYLPRIPAAQYPHFVSLGHQIIDGSFDGLHTLDFGLDCLLEGLRRLPLGRAGHGPAGAGKGAVPLDRVGPG